MMLAFETPLRATPSMPTMPGRNRPPLWRLTSRGVLSLFQHTLLSYTCCCQLRGQISIKRVRRRSHTISILERHIGGELKRDMDALIGNAVIITSGADTMASLYRITL